MSVESVLFDLAKCLVIFSVTFIVMIAAGLLEAAYRRKSAAKNSGSFAGKFAIKAEIRRIVTNKKRFLFFFLVGMFFAIYAVKNIVLRLVFVLVYLGCFLKLYSGDTTQKNSD